MTADGAPRVPSTEAFYRESGVRKEGAGRTSEPQAMFLQRENGECSEQKMLSTVLTAHEEADVSTQGVCADLGRLSLGCSQKPVQKLNGFMQALRGANGRRTMWPAPPWTLAVAGTQNGIQVIV